MIAQPGAAAENVTAAVEGVAEVAMVACVDDEIASSREPFLSFCTHVAVVAAVSVFCANHYGSHHHFFRQFCPCHCWLPHRLHPGSLGYQVGMDH